MRRRARDSGGGWDGAEEEARTVSLSLWVSRKAEYCSSRSLAEAMVLSCQTGAAMAAGRAGGSGS